MKSTFDNYLAAWLLTDILRIVLLWSDEKQDSILHYLGQEKKERQGLGLLFYEQEFWQISSRTLGYDLMRRLTVLFLLKQQSLYEVCRKY